MKTDDLAQELLQKLREECLALGGDDDPILIEVKSLQTIQETLQAQHSATWAMAMAAARRKYDFEADKDKWEAQVSNAILHLPCPPLQPNNESKE